MNCKLFSCSIFIWNFVEFSFFVTVLNFILIPHTNLNNLIKFPKGSYLLIEYVNVTHPPRPQKRYGQLSVTVLRGDDDKYYFNSRADIFEDLGRQRIQFVAGIPRTASDRNYEHVYYRAVFDFCKSASVIVNNPFLRTFLDGFNKGADHVFGKLLEKNEGFVEKFQISGCNTPKGVYKSTNFTFDPNLLIPLKVNSKFRAEFKFFALKLNNKTWVQLYAVHARGVVKNELVKAGQSSYV